MAFSEIGVSLKFEGEGINEKGYVLSCDNPKYQLEIGKEVINIDYKYYRPTEVDLLVGDASKAKNKLGWTPELNIKDLVKDMMESDLKLMLKDDYLKSGGFKTFNCYE